jgi:hypothetical protein
MDFNAALFTVSSNVCLEPLDSYFSGLSTPGISQIHGLKFNLLNVGRVASSRHHDRGATKGYLTATMDG